MVWSFFLVSCFFLVWSVFFSHTVLGWTGQDSLHPAPLRTVALLEFSQEPLCSGVVLACSLLVPCVFLARSLRTVTHLEFSQEPLCWGVCAQAAWCGIGILVSFSLPFFLSCGISVLVSLLYPHHCTLVFFFSFLFFHFLWCQCPCIFTLSPSLSRCRRSWRFLFSIFFYFNCT